MTVMWTCPCCGSVWPGADPTKGEGVQCQACGAGFEFKLSQVKKPTKPGRVVQASRLVPVTRRA
jgi:hypothetical protein